MTDYAFLPFMMVKLASLTDGVTVFDPWSIYEIFVVRKSVERAQKSLQMNQRKIEWSRRMKPVSEFPKIHRELKVSPDGIPWFLKCNPDRLPTWFLKEDPRYRMKPKQSLFRNGHPQFLRSKEAWLNEIESMKTEYGLK